MIEIYQDNELLGKVSLVGGKLKIANEKGQDAGAIVEHFRDWPGRKLSDTELYELLPSRLTGRTSAQPVDESVERFQAMFAKLNDERRDRQEANRAGA